MNFRIYEPNLVKNTICLSMRRDDKKMFYYTININMLDNLDLLSDDIKLKLLIEKADEKIKSLVNEYATKFNNKKEILDFILLNKLEINKYCGDNKKFYNWLLYNNIKLKTITVDNITKENIFLDLIDIDNKELLKCKYNTCKNKRIFETIRSEKIDDCYTTFCSKECLYKWRSDNMSGDKNAVHRTPLETLKKVREKQSEQMKEKIRNGSFTPCITNTWTHYESKIVLNGVTKHFRSSWESFFYLVNPHLDYEKIRIPYKKGKNTHIYIVDFHDGENKKLYEIKPFKMKECGLNKIKEKCALEWCLLNGYEYIQIDEKWFKENFNKYEHLLKGQPNEETLIKKLKRIL